MDRSIREHVMNRLAFVALMVTVAFPQLTYADDLTEAINKARTSSTRLIESQKKDQRRVSNIAASVDKLETGSAAFEAVVQSKLKIISSILSVEALERRNREMENIQVRLNGLRRDIDRQNDEYHSAHNGKHPPVT